MIVIVVVFSLLLSHVLDYFSLIIIFEKTASRTNISHYISRKIHLWKIITNSFFFSKFIRLDFSYFPTSILYLYSLNMFPIDVVVYLHVFNFQHVFMFSRYSPYRSNHLHHLRMQLSMKYNVSHNLKILLGLSDTQLMAQTR